MLSDDEIDAHLDAVLRASGSALRNYSVQLTLDRMRNTMRAVERAAAERMLTDDVLHGARVTKSADGTWLHVPAPSGKKATINLEALALQRGGLVGAALLEWSDSLKIEGAPQ